MDRVMIQLDRISKRYGGVQALCDVSLHLLRGRIHCLAGANGSGKSTLIKVLAGVEKPDSGTLRIGHDRLPHLTPIDSIRRRIQVIYQDLSLFPNLSVAENVSISTLLERRTWHASRRRMRAIARTAIGRLGIDLPLNMAVGRLPVAERQLVAIGRALVQDARVIVLDEPTAALTHLEVDALLQILGKLRGEGVALLFVSHHLQEMERIGDDWTILRSGHVVAQGAADQFTRTRVSYAMTGRDLIAANKAAVNMAKRCKTEDQPSGTGVLSNRVLLEAIALKNEKLHGVSLKVAAGERVGLTGLLGSGPTALAKSLFGLEPYHSGQVLWQGQPMTIRHVGDSLQAGIAYVPEDRLTEGLFLEQSIERNLIATQLEPKLTAREKKEANQNSWSRGRHEQVSAGQGKLGFLSPRHVRRHATRWRDQLDIAAPDVAAPVRTLSGGNQQRVVLAKWLGRHPKLLILNGPTVGVDIGSKEEIHALLRQLAASGMGILMISDDLSELARYSDRVLIMHRGRITGQLAGTELTEDAIQNTINDLL